MTWNKVQHYLAVILMATCMLLSPVIVMFTVIVLISWTTDNILDLLLAILSFVLCGAGAYMMSTFDLPDDDHSLAHP